MKQNYYQWINCVFLFHYIFFVAEIRLFFGSHCGKGMENLYSESLQPLFSCWISVLQFWQWLGNRHPFFSFSQNLAEYTSFMMIPRLAHLSICLSAECMSYFLHLVNILLNLCSDFKWLTFFQSCQVFCGGFRPLSSFFSGLWFVFTS